MTDKHAAPPADRRPNHSGFEAGNGHALSEPDIKGALDAAQLEKLRAEVHALQENAPPPRLDRYIPLITLVCTLITIIVGIVEFRNTSDATKDQLLRAQTAENAKFLKTLNADLARDQANRLHDYAKTYGQSRAAVYLEAVNAAALIAMQPPTDPKRVAAEKLFWQLYWGRMILVEDRDTETKMVDFGLCLKTPAASSQALGEKQKQLRVFSFRLAQACRVSEAITYDPNDAFMEKQAHDLLEDDFLP